VPAEPAVQVPAEPAVPEPAVPEPAVPEPAVPVPAPAPAPASKAKKTASSFDTPEKISEEFAIFIGLQGGKEISRTAANKHILNYIKRHNLQDKTNPKRILPDEKLTHLLRLQEVKEHLTYFNIHKYIHSHFI
jgi:chromatin remodeling complex protein RSC6